MVDRSSEEVEAAVGGDEDPVHLERCDRWLLGCRACAEPRHPAALERVFSPAFEGVLDVVDGFVDGEDGDLVGGLVEGVELAGAGVPGHRPLLIGMVVIGPDATEVDFGDSSPRVGRIPVAEVHRQAMPTVGGGGGGAGGGVRCQSVTVRRAAVASGGLTSTGGDWCSPGAKKEVPVGWRAAWMMPHAT